MDDYNEYWEDDDPGWDEEPEEDYMLYCSYRYKDGKYCTQKPIGEGCEECGTPLCPMHMELGANFCNNCPTEHYNPDYA